MGPVVVLEVSARDAVAFRVAAHGLDRRRSSRESAAARIALPDYPRKAALRGLTARCTGAQVDTLRRALADGTLVRAFSLRGTTHVFAGHDTAAYTTGVLPTPGDEGAARAALGSSWPAVEALDVTAVDAIERVTDEIADAVADGHPRTKGAISEALHDRLPDGWEPWCERCAAHHAPEQLFRLAAIAAGLRFVDDGADMTAGPRPDLTDHADARAELVRRFLGAYAPAPSRAFAEWSGLGPTEAEASFAAVGDEIVGVRIDRRSAFALGVDQERLQHPPTITGVRLVPAGDPFLNQRDRATLLPDPDHRRRLWRPAGAPGLVLVDGAPAGIWRHRHDENRFVVTAELWKEPPHDQLTSPIREEAFAFAATEPTPRDQVHVEIQT